MIYIIGDVHGCYKTLLALIDKLPNKDAKIVFVGDLIDRGKNSRDIIEYIRANNHDCVLGNHEYLMIKSYPYINVDNSNEIIQRWFTKGGGRSTVQNYKSTEDMKEDVHYLKSLPLYIEYKDIKDKNGRYLVVTHSAVGKTWKLKNSSNKEDRKTFKTQVLWSRYRHSDNKEIFNVYGHTILEEPFINEYHANVDLGCYAKNKIANPRLCALEFPSMKIYTQKNIEE